MLGCAEVAQFGRALDSTADVVEGEAEDRVVAGSSPAPGTITLSFRKEPVLQKFEFCYVELAFTDCDWRFLLVFFTCFV
ncbi:MAG: hypothetical protein WC325_06450 [Candidatus Bathyarchaeia archaeon]